MNTTIKEFTKDDIQVRKVNGFKFNGVGYTGWALYVEGLGFMAFDGEELPYMLGAKKYMKAILDGWGFDWNYKFIQAD